MIRINIGSGNKIVPGYIGIDVMPGPNVDVVSDVRALPYDTGTVDEAMSIHVIEHFYRWEVADVLREWIRVLKPGGRLIVECPDLDKAVLHYLHARQNGEPISSQLVMWPLYGDPGHMNQLMCHRWGYSPDTLAALMAECGLVDLRQEDAQFHMKTLRDMRIVGMKPTH